MRFQIESLSAFICLIMFSSIFEELLASEKDFEQFFPYHCLLTLLLRLLIKFSVHLFIKQYFLLRMTHLDSKVIFFFT